MLNLSLIQMPRYLFTHWAKAEALRDILTDTVAEAKAVTLGDTLGNVEGKTMV